MPVEIIREGNLSSPQQRMKQLEISHAEDFMGTQSNVNFSALGEQLKTQSIVDYIIHPKSSTSPRFYRHFYGKM